MGYVGYQEGIYPNRCWFFVYFDHKSFNFKSDLEIPSHGIKDFQSAAGRGWIRLRDPYSALFSQLGWMHRRSSNDHTSKNLFGTYCFFFFLLRSSINLLHYTAIPRKFMIFLGWRTNFADTEFFLLPSDGEVALFWMGPKYHTAYPHSMVAHAFEPLQEIEGSAQHLKHWVAKGDSGVRHPRG